MSHYENSMGYFDCPPSLDKSLVNTRLLNFFADSLTKLLEKWEISP